MKLKRIFYGSAIVLAAVCMFFCGWFAARFTLTEPDPTTPTTEAALEVPWESTADAAATATPDASTAATPTTETISVAIYPHLPDLEMAQNTLARMWEEIDPDTELEFIYWDCYEDPYPHGIDVICYDAMFLDYLVENGLILPLDLEALGDTTGILPFAMEGARYDGDLYGLPFLACSYFLIHYSDDWEMAQVQNFEDLYKLLSARKEQNPYDGLQSNYQDNISNFYLEALLDYTGTYTTFEEAPSLYPPEAAVTERLRQVESLTPWRSEYIYDWYYQSRFAQGEGSACYTFSESLYYMEDVLEWLVIRPISFFEGENVLMYYTDIASIGSHVTDPEKKKSCEQLVNLLGSPEYQAQLCYGSGEVQYLLPAREQVYLAAAEEYPIYEELYKLATDERNRIFRFGSDIYDYMERAYTALS